MRTRIGSSYKFIQSLANPRYLHHLATTTTSTTSTTTSSKNNNKNEDDDDDDDKEPIDILNSKEMIEYLSYLQYWYRDPRYSKYILYPHCLYFLKLLQTDEFRKAMQKPTKGRGSARGAVYVLGGGFNRKSEESDRRRPPPPTTVSRKVIKRSSV